MTGTAEPLWVTIDDHSSAIFNAMGIKLMLLNFSYIMCRRWPGSRGSDEEEKWVGN